MAKPAYGGAGQDSGMEERLLVDAAIDTHKQTTGALGRAVQTLLEAEELGSRTTAEVHNQNIKLNKAVDDSVAVAFELKKAEKTFAKLERSCCWAFFLWCCCCCCVDDKDHKKRRRGAPKTPTNVTTISQPTSAPYHPPQKVTMMSARPGRGGQESSQRYFDKGPDVTALKTLGYGQEAEIISNETNQQSAHLQTLDAGLDRLKHVAVDMGEALTAGDDTLNTLGAAVDINESGLKKAQARTRNLLK